MGEASEMGQAVTDLCCLFFPYDEGASKKYLRHTLSLICNQIFAGEPESELHIKQKIQRRLARLGKTFVAVKFGKLCQQLEASKTVQKRTELLQFLFALSNQDKSHAYQNGDAVTKMDHFRPSKKQDQRPATLTFFDPASADPACSSTVDRPLDAATLTSSGASSQSSTSSGRRGKSEPRPLISEPRPLAARNDYDSEALKVSEEDMLRDVLFALQGIDGRYIRFDSNSGEFIINPRDPISNPTKDLISRLVECGILLMQVKNLCEFFNAPQRKGCVTLALISSVQDELTEYYRTLATYQSQLDFQKKFRDREIERLQSEFCGLTLRRLLPLLMKWKEKFALLAAILDSCQELRGGQIISTLHAFWTNGDVELSRLVGNLLESVCRPLLFTIGQWAFEGLLDDPYSEFFITCNECTTEENAWKDKFSLRTEMLPCFLNVSLANKVLLAGKSIYFLGVVRRDSSVFLPHLESKRLALKNLSASCLFDYSQKDRFDSIIEFAYSEISGHLLETLNGQFDLCNHFLALKKYILLSQGDFAQCIIDLLQEDLDKPVSQVYRHNIVRHLDVALRQTNAQFEPKAILERINVEFLDKTDGDSGWDIFQLKYSNKGILSTLLSHECLNFYGRLFDFIWRLKRVSFCLCNVWDDGILLKKRKPVIPECFHLQHSFYLHTSQMVFFVEQMQYYFLFEVLECAYNDLVREIGKARDLDDVIRSHGRYLDILMEKSLLKNANNNLLHEFRTIIGLIFKYCVLNREFINELWVEMDQRTSCRSGKIAIPSIELKEEQLRAAKINASFKSRVSILLDQYKHAVMQFLQILTSQDEEHLRLLSFRLNFTEFYSRS